jgi:hypothetical protein
MKLNTDLDRCSDPSVDCLFYKAANILTKVNKKKEYLNLVTISISQILIGSLSQPTTPGNVPINFDE